MWLMVFNLPAQVADFTAPDTVYTGMPVNITNTTTGGSSWYWSFCSGNVLSDPVGTNIGNPGNLLDIPGYITLLKDGNTCYSFIPNQGRMSLVRYNHGSSFNNNPVSWTDLGGFGLLSDTVMGIKICYDNGQWIGILNNNNRLVQLNFGTSLANTPSAVQLGPFPLLRGAHFLDILKEGNTWIGFISCYLSNKLVRLNFGNSLLNTPALTDLGAPGSMNFPGPMRFVSENGLWYALVANTGNGTMTRLSFGNSLLTTPTGVNLGVVCPSINAAGIALIRDCEGTTGFQLNYSTSSPDKIWRLTFPTGMTGPVSSASLGNIGNMTQPAQFSELFRTGDTLFLYNSNRQGTLTRLRFLPCADASNPSSVLFTPPPYSYDKPGTYNIRLTVNEGLPNQSSYCKKIVVINATGIVTAAFTAPDPVCTGNPVIITNQSTPGKTYYWNFCSGNAGGNPSGTNIGNPGSNLDQPVYNTLVQDGTDCYSFVTNHGFPTHMTRVYYGSNFRNNPVSSAIILQTGVISQLCEAIQVRKENGNWYGFLNNNSTILRLDFGASITNNSPVATDIGPFPNISVAHGLVIIKEGVTWLGFFDSDTQNKLYRLNFGTRLTNTPVFTDLGNLAGFSHPCQIASVKENGICYLLLVNSVGNSLSRLNFGTSYLNVPSGQNLGDCGALVSPVGITLVNDCETSTGYYTVYQASASAAIGRLTFAGGVGGTITAASLGNIGTLHYPVTFSELFRQNDSLFSYVPNQYSSSLTRFSFPPCNNSSAPSSTLYSPPGYSYNQPGTYNIMLNVDEGLPDQASLCKKITVINKPAPGFVDTTLCFGTPWHVGGGVHTQPGIYYDTIHIGSCDSVVKTTLSYKPRIPVDLGKDTIICGGLPFVLHAGVNAMAY